MGHEIDMSNARANIAYAGETPWHGLGQQLTPGASIDVWTREAGLGFHVERAAVNYTADGKQHVVSGKDVLYRDDTQAPLGIVSGRYNIVQPKEVMDFFAKLVDIGGFELETAGSLYGGQKIWALAKVGAGVEVADKDAVRPYLLLGTSFDGTLATTGMFTAVRVVCNNTITMALRRESEKTTVKVPHFSQFNANSVREQLGIGVDLWTQWVARTKAFAKRKLSGEEADDIIVKALRKDEEQPEEDIRESRAYQSIMRLFEGEAIGSQLGAPRTAWQLINATTEYVDHHIGNKQDSRLRSAWFGSGASLKARVQDLLAA